MSRAEAFNSLSHLVGATLALAGMAVLVVLAATNGDARRIVAFSVYGLTLFLLYLISTLYHGLPGRAKRVFGILDHQAIYLLIAGTYTPFTLVTLEGAVGWGMFAAIWGMAITGIVLDAFPRHGPRVLPVLFYLAMGWLVLLALDPLLAVLPSAGLRWLLVGGVLYSSGVVFFALGRYWPWAHGIWHLFVLAGSISHYVGIALYV